MPSSLLAVVVRALTRSKAKRTNAAAKKEKLKKKDGLTLASRKIRPATASFSEAIQRAVRENKEQPCSYWKNSERKKERERLSLITGARTNTTQPCGAKKKNR